MIKFFRKIHQKLLSENKFSKYLLYAIGEIVLVVIGMKTLNNKHSSLEMYFHDSNLLSNSLSG
jgi:hypothetical protein